MLNLGIHLVVKLTCSGIAVDNAWLLLSHDPLYNDESDVQAW